MEVEENYHMRLHNNTHFLRVVPAIAKNVIVQKWLSQNLQPPRTKGILLDT